MSDPIRFAAYAFARATHEDMKLFGRFLSADNLRDARDHAPPAIIDFRSWACRNSKFGRYLAPPIRTRKRE